MLRFIYMYRVASERNPYQSRTITIKDTGTDNISLCDMSLLYNHQMTISMSAINQIKDIISANESVYNIDEIEDEIDSLGTITLDGYANEFTFFKDSSSNRIETYNIRNYLRYNPDSGNPEPVKALLLLKVHNEIKSILLKNGVNPKYLALDV